MGLVKWGVPDTVPVMAMEGGWARYDWSGAVRGTERDEVGEVGGSFRVRGRITVGVCGRLSVERWRIRWLDGIGWMGYSGGVGGLCGGVLLGRCVLVFGEWRGEWWGRCCQDKGRRA